MRENRTYFLFRCVFFYWRRAGMVRRYFYFSGIRKKGQCKDEKSKCRHKRSNQGGRA